MLISYNWIKQYVDLPDSLSAEELALKLTMSTVEVEGVEKQGESMNGVVVGEMLEIKKHPDADKLSVAQVDVGEAKPRQIVFGQMVEMKVGLKIPVALAPTVLPGKVKIKKSKLRGVESQGMLCIDQEIGLAEEGVSIQFFDKDIKNGTPIIEVLGLNDAVLDIDNKSMTHRPDLWGHYGIAREIAAVYHKKLKKYDPATIKKQETRNLPAGRHGKQTSNIKLQVDVQDTELCPRYMAVAIDGVTVKPSPQWMQNLLLSVGLKPINNIVDITNYILFDLGQPMHGFDARQLSTNDDQRTQIVVRRAGDGEKFTTLDDAEHQLTGDMLVIADGEKAVALAGIMGGQNSEISNDTTTVIFESANFDATNVRRTATKLGIRTDSSTRFEKSLDPNNAELALRRAVELTLELCPDAKVVSNVADEKNFKLNQGPIELSLDFINRKIGKEIEKKEVIKILESLGFEIKDKKEKLFVTVPTWRATKDISIVEDLVEEIARIYGYSNIEVTLPTFSIAPPERNDLRILERRAKDMIAMEYGYTETYNYSFVSPEVITKMGLNIDDHIELDNPIAKDRPYVRTTLLPNLLENVEKNMHYKDNVRLFEVGQVFDKHHSGVRAEKKGDELLPRQDVMLALVYSNKNDKTPFYEVSEVVSDMLRTFGVDYKLKTKTKPDSYVHPGRQAHIVVGETIVGFVAELHPHVQADLGIDERVGIVEINLNTLLGFVKDKNDYTRIPLYPGVLRDIAFVVDMSVVHADVVQAIKQVDPLITRVELFDVFENKKLGENKKSMAYHITYMSDKKTLEAVDVDKVHGKVGEMLKKKFGAEVRS